MSAPVLLVTRPRREAEALARDVAAQGWRPLVWPLIEIVPVGAPPDLRGGQGGAQALILSSANAARRCAPGPGDVPAPVPALCVGAATAQAARDAGFADARAAGGDAGGGAAALVALVRASLDPAAGPLAFARGETVAADIAGALRSAGFTVDESVVYAARPARAAPDAVARALREGAVAAAAFYSPRTAAVFAGLAGPWREGLAHTTAVAISAAAAAALADAGLARVIVAARPDSAAMLDAIAAARPSGAGTQGLVRAAAATNLRRGHAGEDDRMSGEKKPDDEPAAALSGSQGEAPRPQGESPSPADDASTRRDDADEAAAERAGSGRDDDSPVWGDRDVVDVTPVEDRAESAPSESAPEAAPEPQAEPEPQVEPARAEAAPQEKVQEPARSGGFASKALAALVLLIAGAALAIWGAPRLAPMLPASLAAMIAPAGAASDPAVAALSAETARLGAALAEATARADAAGAAAAAADASAEAALSAAASMTDRLAQLDGAIAQATQGGDDPALAARQAQTEAALAELRAALAAGEGDGSLAELQAGVRAQAQEIAALAARVDAPAADPAVGTLAERIAGLEQRLDAMIAAQEAAQEAAQAEQAAAAQTREAMSLAAALAAVERAMYYGAPFAEPLTDAAGAASVAAPAALSAAAGAGAPTAEALAAGFDDAARDAIAATLEADADADGGVLAAVMAKIEARLTGLPTEAIDGDDAQAVLSRARAAVTAGDVAGALAALEALPAPAREAMAGWIADARLRAEADAAFAAWRAEVGGQ